MREHVFDALTRQTAVASRRGYARALAGLALGGLWSSVPRLDDVEARKKGRKRKQKRNKNKRRKNTTKTRPLTCTASCAGKACGDDGCGGSCGLCDSGQFCTQGQCVVGQGTCQTGDDICVDLNHTCEIGGDCVCWTSTSNQTRCGQFRPIINVTGICASDDDCALRFPDTPGVFCVNPTGGNCTGAGGACHAPCFAG